MLSAEVIAIGSELLSARFVDTNSTYLTEQLNGIGIAVALRTIVGDDEKYLEHAFRSAMDRVPLVITIGGLGPTEDDITKKVLARVLQRQLILDDESLRRIEARFRARGAEMPANNARQALILSGSEVLENQNGTAPGLWVNADRTQFVLLPGPPVELHAMFERLCLPRLKKLAGNVVLERRVYKVTGLGESTVDAKIAPIYNQYRNPETTILATKPGQVEVRLTARAKTSAEAEHLLKELGDQIDHALEEHIFARSEQTLEEVVAMYLMMKQATISVAESCTGGLLAQRLTSVPGSSRYFVSGVVCYSNESKIQLAGIPPLLVEMQGAVSEEVARGLADGIRANAKTTFGVGITGIAGPDGGSAAKPVGTVHVAVAGPDETQHRHFVFPGDRERVRYQASQAALNMVRRMLG